MKPSALVITTAFLLNQKHVDASFVAGCFLEAYGRMSEAERKSLMSYIACGSFISETSL